MAARNDQRDGGSKKKIVRRCFHGANFPREHALPAHIISLRSGKTISAISWDVRRYGLAQEPVCDAAGIIVGTGDHALVVDGCRIGSLKFSCSGARRVEYFEFADARAQKSVKDVVVVERLADDVATRVDGDGKGSLIT